MMTYSCQTCHHYHADRTVKCLVANSDNPQPCYTHPIASRWHGRPAEVIPQPAQVNHRIKLEVAND